MTDVIKLFFGRVSEDVQQQQQLDSVIMDAANMDFDLAKVCLYFYLRRAKFMKKKDFGLIYFFTFP